MIKVDIRNTQGVIGWSASWNSQEEANHWISQGISENWWGKPERWLSPDISGEIYGENIENALDSRVVIDRPGQEAVFDDEENEISPATEEQSHTEYLFAAEYTIEQSDTTAQDQLETATAQALKNQDIGSIVVARVAAVNEQKLTNGSMTQQQFNALLADQNIANIERLLWNGSLITAKSLISALDNTYYSDEEKAGILAMFP